MKVLQIHNYYRFRGGEDVIYDVTCSVLESMGHHIVRYTRDSRECVRFSGKARAFFEEFYAMKTKRDVAKLLADQQPDLIHVHNIYPYISCSVLRAAEEAGVPVVMRCPNYRLVCPIGTHLRHGEICDLCVGGHELACIKHNCRENIFESVAYAGRAIATRKLGLVKERVACFVPPSAFVKQRLVDAGFPGDRIHVLPNLVTSMPQPPGMPSRREYIAFAGRISPEKGIATLLAAARETGLPVRAAGEVAKASEHLTADAPRSVTFLGRLSRDALAGFYRGARFQVTPSVWYEPFGLTLVEAMSQGVPVVASRIGGIPEIIEDGVTGLLFEPGNAADLAEKMLRLWRDPELCERMGRAALERAQREHNETVYYRGLMKIYRAAAGFRGGVGPDGGARRDRPTQTSAFPRRMRPLPADASGHDPSLEPHKR